jgi:hypothetical protein
MNICTIWQICAKKMMLKNVSQWTVKKSHVSAGWRIHHLDPWSLDLYPKKRKSYSSTKEKISVKGNICCRLNPLAWNPLRHSFRVIFPRCVPFWVCALRKKFHMGRRVKPCISISTRPAARLQAYNCADPTDKPASQVLDVPSGNLCTSWFFIQAVCQTNRDLLRERMWIHSGSSYRLPTPAAAATWTNPMLPPGLLKIPPTTTVLTSEV